MKTGRLKDLKVRNRNKRFFVLSIALVMACAGTVSCVLVESLEKYMGYQWRLPRPVVIEGKGPEAAVNFSFIAWVAGPDGKGSTALLLRDRDPFSLELSEGKGAWLPYHWSDGSRLSVAGDGFSSLLNGKRVVLDLSADKPGLDWISRANPREIAHLRACILTGPVGGAGSLQWKALEKISQIKPDMAWVVTSKEALHRVLETFDPPWLMIDLSTPLASKDMALISKKRKLEYLIFGAKEMGEGVSLRFPKSLHTLVLSKWDPGKTGPLPEDLKFLKALTIRESAISYLAGIPCLENLEELHLVSCPKLTDLSVLSGKQSLKALTLTNCKGVSDLSAIKDLKNLQWLGLPPGTSQVQFEELISKHSGLRVLEIIECGKIRDMKPVGALKQLESLVVLGGRVDAGHLRDLKSVRFLALSKKSFKNRQNIEAIKKAHAGMVIVHAEPFCLGSGWILLLWPALFTGWILARRRSGKGRPVERHA